MKATEDPFQFFVARMAAVSMRPLCGSETIATRNEDLASFVAPLAECNYQLFCGKERIEL
jgi:hypothetical protein